MKFEVFVFNFDGIIYGFYICSGGYLIGFYESLNIGFGLQDDCDSVLKNWV